MADISGTVDEEILILPDQDRLRQVGMTMDEFGTLIKGVNISLGSLTIRDGEYRYNVKFDSRASSAEDISSIWLKREGRMLQVKDIAKVVTHPAKRTGLVRSDGKDAVCLAVIKQSEASSSGASDTLSLPVASSICTCAARACPPSRMRATMSSPYRHARASSPVT